MSFQREGDPLDVAARGAATQIRCEVAARGLSEKIALPENTTGWDAIFCAEANLIRALPEADLRRNASIVYNRYADVAGPEKAAQRAANALDVTNCDPELLRADLLAVHNETARIYLLGYQVERERGELARFVIYIGFAALATFMTFISWAFMVQLPGVSKRTASIVVAVLGVLLVFGLWWYEKRRGEKRRASAAAAGLLVVLMTAFPAERLLAQGPPDPTATTTSGTAGTTTGGTATAGTTTGGTTTTGGATTTAGTTTAGTTATTTAKDGGSKTTAASPGPPKEEAASGSNTPVRIPIAPLVILTGILGACFSVLQRVQRSWAGDPLVALLNLRNARAHIFLSIITGAIAALVMFAVFTGEMISGSLFPKIVNAATPAGGQGHMLLVYDFLASTGPATFADYGRLLVWAFIAGFAERFVPDILDRFVSSTRKQ